MKRYVFLTLTLVTSCSIFAQNGYVSLDNLLTDIHLQVGKVSGDLIRKQGFTQDELYIAPPMANGNTDTTIYLSAANAQGGTNNFSMNAKQRDTVVTRLVTFSTADSAWFYSEIKKIADKGMQEIEVAYNSNYTMDPHIFQKDNTRIKTYWSQEESKPKVYTIEIIQFDDPLK